MTDETDIMLLKKQIAEHVFNTDSLYADMKQAMVEYNKQNDDRFTALHGHFNRRMDEFDERLKEETKAKAEILEAINANSAKSDAIAESVAGILHIEESIKGSVVVGGAVQSLIWWLMKWGVIGAGLAGGITWILDKFSTS